jgi:Holliday junction resolvasome RuvABC endonuclease subunit
MRVLAIDPGANCGFAMSDSGERIAVGTWDLSTRRDESAGMKLLRLESKLVETMKAGPVDLLVYETPANHTYPLALISHAKYIGVIERFCTKHKINYRGYAPKEIKKFATGNGNAGKPLVIEAVRKRFGYDGDDNNEADAIALLELARSTYDVSDDETPF